VDRHARAPIIMTTNRSTPGSGPPARRRATPVARQAAADAAAGRACRSRPRRHRARPVAELGGDEIVDPGLVVGQSLIHVTIERHVIGGKLRRIDVSWTAVADRLEFAERLRRRRGSRRPASS
jgi:hypothetical protein